MELNNGRITLENPEDVETALSYDSGLIFGIVNKQPPLDLSALSSDLLLRAAAEKHIVSYDSNDEVCLKGIVALINLSK